MEVEIPGKEKHMKTADKNLNEGNYKISANLADKVGGVFNPIITASTLLAGFAISLVVGLDDFPEDSNLYKSYQVCICTTALLNLGSSLILVMCDLCYCKDQIILECSSKKLHLIVLLQFGHSYFQYRFFL